MKGKKHHPNQLVLGWFRFISSVTISDNFMKKKKNSLPLFPCSFALLIFGLWVSQVAVIVEKLWISLVFHFHFDDENTVSTLKRNDATNEFFKMLNGPRICDEHTVHTAPELDFRHPPNWKRQPPKHQIHWKIMIYIIRFTTVECLTFIRLCHPFCIHRHPHFGVGSSIPSSIYKAACLFQTYFWRIWFCNIQLLSVVEYHIHGTTVLIFDVHFVHLVW